MAYETAPPAHPRTPDFLFAIGPESRAGILPKRGGMSKRKLHKRMRRAPQTIHSFSTRQNRTHSPHRRCEFRDGSGLFVLVARQRRTAIKKTRKRVSVEIRREHSRQDRSENLQIHSYALVSRLASRETRAGVEKLVREFPGRVARSLLRAVRAHQSFEIGKNPGLRLPFAMDGPVQERTADHGLHGIG